MTTHTRIIVAACFLCGCSSSKNAVELAVGAATLEAAKREAVRTLTVDVAGAITASKSYDVSGLRAEERIELVPSISSGTLTITVTAIDDRTNVVGRGSTDVALTGDRVRAGVTLNPVGPPAIAVTPSRAKVTRTRSQRFTADKPVNWAVTDGGGTIDTDGLYTAPDAPGNASITATLSTDDTISVTVPIEIADYGIELLAGPADGPGWADGIGGNARFAQAGNVVATAAGDVLYIAERDWCVIRKLVLATAEVTTFAGRFEECASVDGPSASARLNYPWSIALDENAGVLYVADFGSLRSVNLATGELSTVLNQPLGSATGMVKHPTEQRLFMTRTNQHTVLEIDLTVVPPTLTIIAGTVGAAGSADGTGTAASFRSPRGLATDGQSLFVADTGNNTIRRLNLTSKAVTTIAGSAGDRAAVDGLPGTSRLLGPVALSYDAGAVRFTDSDFSRANAIPSLVRTLVIANNSVSTLAGTVLPAAVDAPAVPATQVDGIGTAATFADAIGIATTSAFVYVTEGAQGTVRRIPRSGNTPTATIAGAPAQYGARDGEGSLARFWFPATLVISGRTAYITDNANATVRVMNVDTGFVQTLTGLAGVYGALDGTLTTARYRRPDAIAAIGQTVYITDSEDSTLRAIDIDTGNVRLLAGSHGAFGQSDGRGTAARFGSPHHMTSDGSHILYLTDGPLVRQVDTSTAAVTTVAGSAVGYQDGMGSAAQFDTPEGVALDQNILYVSDANNHRIRAIDIVTRQVTTFLGGDESIRNDGVGDSVRFVRPTVLIGDGHGTLYVIDGSTVRRIAIATRSVVTLAGRPEVERTLQFGPLPGALFAPGGLALDESGDLVLTEYLPSTVARIRIPKP